MQLLPLALLAGILYILIKRRRHPHLPLGRTLLSALFVCYLTGLLCLTLFHDILGNVYYWLFYHMSSGSSVHWFTFEYYLKLEFLSSLSSERLGNLLLFLPFGILYPLFDLKATWKRTLLTGAGISVAIELLQPIFGRIFDINDIALNMIGVLVSTTIFFTLRCITSPRA